MAAPDIEAWVARQKMHYGGKIDWKQEYERLLSTAEQAVQAPDSHAARSVLKTAVECGHVLLESEEQE